MTGVVKEGTLNKHRIITFPCGCRMDRMQPVNPRALCKGKLGVKTRCQQHGSGTKWIPD